ncbi:hypothetical protein V6N13_099962 [Hibiscus sabdariffa]
MKKLIQEMEALQVELEREIKEKEEFRAKLQKEQLWRSELLEQLYKQATNYRECALFEVQLKYEALEQQRNRRDSEDATAVIG